MYKIGKKLGYTFISGTVLHTCKLIESFMAGMLWMDRFYLTLIIHNKNQPNQTCPNISFSRDLYFMYRNYRCITRTGVWPAPHEHQELCFKILCITRTRVEPAPLIHVL